MATLQTPQIDMDLRDDADAEAHGELLAWNIFLWTMVGAVGFLAASAKVIFF